MDKFNLYDELGKSSLFCETVYYGTINGIKPMKPVANGQMIDFDYLITNADKIEVWFKQFTSNDCKISVMGQGSNGFVYYNGSFMNMNPQNVQNYPKIQPIVDELLRIRSVI